MAGYSSPSDYLGNVLGAPVTITSGLRTPGRNALVGGVPNSAHLTGQAYDFVPKGLSTSEAAQRLAQSGIPFDQIEDGGDHVHISFAPANRRQVIKAKMPISDDDLLKALTGGGKTSAANPAPQTQQGPSDDDLLKALTGGSKSQTAAGDSKKPVGSKPSYMGREFGFTQEVESHIPFAKDIAAGLPAGLDALTGRGSFGENYRQNLSDYNAAQAAYEEQNPGLSGLGTGIGILASGNPAGGAGSAVPQTLGQLMKAGAKGGATLGALFGFGEATPSFDERAGNTLLGAGTGTAVGGALPIAGAGLAKAGKAVGGAVNRLIPDAATTAAKKAKGIIEDFAGGEIDPNPTQIVPGSHPTLAESVKNPGVSVLQKQITQLNPNSPLVSRAAQNAQARLESLEKTTGTKADLESLVEARDAAATADLKEVFSKPRKAVITSVLAKIKEIESGSSGQRPSISKSMTELRELIGEGTTKDAETLYNSVRKGIGDLIDGKNPEKAHGVAAMREILQVRDVLDKVIDHSAPGFKKYLDEYSESSGPVTSMKFLQGLNLTDAQGNLTLQKVQTAIKNIGKQQAMPGKREAKAVTEAQLGALRSIRDDLLRQTNLDLSKARGSDTVQNLMAQKRLGLSRFIPEGIGATVGGGIGGLVGGQHGIEIGGMIGDRLGAAYGSMKAARQMQAQNLLQATLEDMMLNPGRYQRPMQGIPSQMRPLNELLSSPRSRAAIGAGNRLAIVGMSRPKEKDR